MPLTYDEIPGSWADLSQDWHKVHFASKAFTDCAYQYCVKKVPYGSYVHMQDHIRVETEDQKSKLIDYLIRNDIPFTQ